MTTSTKQPAVLETRTTDRSEQPAYEAPRITRKRSLERITLGSGTVTPGGGVGGN
ncbi:MAG: hypothetical protein IPQ24_18670 [Anaeromyxobacter sp.]|nr:hypothetical protein [Anaeromyxobacter sp.]